MTRPRRDARPYHRSGEHIVAKAMPFLVDRVTDPAVPETALSPLDRGLRVHLPPGATVVESVLASR